jgi:hypothetical protein
MAEEPFEFDFSDEEEEIDAEDFAEMTPEVVEEPTFDDEFDRLREQTARTSAVYDDMELDELDEEEDEGFLAQISPSQRLILLLLLLIDVVVIAVGAMAVFGVI